jgi:2',3'-cyclic-nucleotide 2'-phosphodiesterase (5'-nucleotidase family)
MNRIVFRQDAAGKTPANGFPFTGVRRAEKGVEMNNRIRNRIVSCAMAAAVAVSTFSVLPRTVKAQDTSPQSFTFEVLSTTDMHGRGTTDNVSTQKEDVNSMERVASVVKAEKATYGDHTVIVDNGDLYQGTLVTQYQMSSRPNEENPMTTALKTIGYDALVMGNHEFNYTAEQRNAQLSFLKDAGIPALGANIVLKTAGKNFDGENVAAGSPYYKPYTVKTIDFGSGKKVRVAVIGLGNAANATWDQADHYPNMQFSSLDNPNGILENEINKWTSYIKTNHLADIIIVSAHSGKGTDDGVESSNFMLESQVLSGTKNSHNTDLVIYGHDHRENKEQVTDADGKKVWIMNGGGSSVTKNVFTVNFNSDGTIKDYSVTDAETLDLKNYTSDADLGARTQSWYDETYQWASGTLGTFSGGWNSIKSEVQGKNNPDLVLSQTHLMNFISKAMIWSTWQSFQSDGIQGATVAFASPVFGQNNDQRRTIAYVPSDGDKINTLNLSLLYRFGNNLSCCVEMTGDQIYQWMSTVADRYTIGSDGNAAIKKSESVYGIDTFYGIDYVFDLTKPEGQRVVRADYNGKSLKGSSEKIRVALNNYRLSGGYKFAEVTGISEEDAVWTADKYLGADRSPMLTQIGEYVRAMKTVTPNDKVSHGKDTSWSLKVKADPAVPSASANPMYRVYNPNSGEHFYTASKKEKDYLVSVGWNDEGTGWYAPRTSKTPVYRLYNAVAGEHHYTTSAAEKDYLVKAGWNYESIGWYSDDSKTVPVYRQYNPNAFSCNHNFTTNEKEKNGLIRIGWRDEGIGWYGVKAV